MMIICPNCQEKVPTSEFKVCEFHRIGIDVSAVCPNCKAKILVEVYGDLEVYEESENGVCF